MSSIGTLELCEDRRRGIAGPGYPLAKMVDDHDVVILLLHLGV